MSLRNKAILMICVGFAAALVMTFVVSQTILMKRFRRVGEGEYQPEHSTGRQRPVHRLHQHEHHLWPDGFQHRILRVGPG